MANPNFKTKQSIGQNKSEQLNYNENTKSRKTLEVTPTPVAIFSDTSTAAVKVGKGNLCRVFGTTNDFVAFGIYSIAVPDASTANAAKMSSTCQIFVATDDYLRTSATTTRVEVIED